jgi:hypothetical protein
MDAALDSAITAVHLGDDDTARRWFELVRTTYDQLAAAGRPEWSEFTSALTENADSSGVDRQTVEQFVEHMSANDSAPVDTVERMTQLGTELPAHHAELTATQEDDTAAWQAFLPEHGARWDGQEASWDQFRTWFLYEAGQQGAEQSATAFITYAESQPDKVAVFAEYGVTIASETAAEDAFPEVKPGDSGEWVDYLDTMLTRHGF